MSSQFWADSSELTMRSDILTCRNIYHSVNTITCATSNFWICSIQRYLQLFHQPRDLRFPSGNDPPQFSLKLHRKGTKDTHSPVLLLSTQNIYQTTLRYELRQVNLEIFYFRGRPNPGVLSRQRQFRPFPHVDRARNRDPRIPQAVLETCSSLRLSIYL